MTGAPLSGSRHDRVARTRDARCRSRTPRRRWAGAGRRSASLTEAAGFLARGHRVVVYARAGRAHLAEAPRFGVPAVRAADRAQAPGGRARAGPRAFARTPVDVVNTHSSTDTWLAALACRWLRAARGPAPVLVRTRHVSVPVPNDPRDALALPPRDGAHRHHRRRAARAARSATTASTRRASIRFRPASTRTRFAPRPRARRAPRSACRRRRR